MAKSANPLSNPSTILYLAAAGAGAYYAFKVLKKRSAKTPQDQFNADIEKMKQGQAEQAAAEAKRKANERAIQQSTSIANPNSFAGKVARIQTILGVAVDGVPGRITNGAYQKRFGLDKGPITVVNVSYYLDKAESDSKFLQL